VATETKLRKVVLHGHLADGIGSEIELAFHTPGQAIQLLELNFPGFAQKFADGHFFVTAQTPVGERDLPKEGLLMGFTGDLVIMPAAFGNATGKRKGLLGALLGAVIVGAAFFMSGGALGAALPGVLGGLGATWGAVAKLGLALLANGIAQVLTPTPDTNYDGVDEARSFIFNGPTNITTPGGPLPLIYGKHMAGTATVSAAMDIEMLQGGFGQRVLTPEFQIVQGRGQVSVDMSDIMNDDDGCVMTHIDGIEITEAMVTDPNSYTYSKAANLEVEVTSRVQNQLMYIRHVVGSDPVIAGAGERFTFTATVTHGGNTYNPTFDLVLGFQGFNPGQA